ncbi:Receptor-type guanylate cyclase gcy-23 [Parelaphostrongylus tenuis]|uniref:guanylate cyclase n=1 Tax=Parelaphostrongylus tenuis TaxID=148309 RepID=A0AAD5QN46_PARTN|nr:Receptor-type guanylate cyclase gcy-23 [Parelaphostrongylus tenuis]
MAKCLWLWIKFGDDIVGFTTICSSSTPLEVVNMLNGIYTKFDDVINKNQAYKVETIGDAYMVVSGIPEENGTRHIMHISDTALEIMELLKTFEIPHRRDTRLRIRIGFHCGSVAAGVVGLTAPRYCLFGDTVNMASRMESTGEPEKIQMSENAREMLRRYYPEFITELRGTVEVKGKGACNTYWLLGKEEIQNASFDEARKYL